MFAAIIPNTQTLLRQILFAVTVDEVERCSGFDYFAF
jgi:hypothetical protein